MFKNLKIGARLALGFALVLILLISISALSFQRISALDKETSILANEEFPKTVLANDIIDAVNAATRQLRNAFLYTGQERTNSLDQIIKQGKIINESLEKLEKILSSNKDRELFKLMVAARAAYRASQDKAIQIITSDKKPDVQKAEFIQLLQGELRKTQAEYIKRVVDLIDYQTELVSQSGKDATSMATEAKQLILAMAIVAVIIAVLFAWWVTRSITRPHELHTLDKILPLAKQLLKEVDYSNHPIRLIGLSVSNPKEEREGTVEKERWEQLSFEFSDRE